MQAFAQRQKQKSPQPQTSIETAKPSAKAPAESLATHLLPRVQRTLGKQPVPRVLRTKASHPDTHSEGVPSFGPAPGNDLTRLSGPSKSPTVQTKLTVNIPGDIYEQEAEHVSQQVMRMPEPQVQRACACGGSCATCQKERSRPELAHVEHHSGGTAPLQRAPNPQDVHDKGEKKPKQDMTNCAKNYLVESWEADTCCLNRGFPDSAAKSKKAEAACCNTFPEFVDKEAAKLGGFDGAASCRTPDHLNHKARVTPGGKFTPVDVLCVDTRGKKKPHVIELGFEAAKKAFGSIHVSERATVCISDKEEAKTCSFVTDCGETTNPKESQCMPAGCTKTAATSEKKDIQKQEAEHVSPQILRMPMPQVQRACACGGSCANCQKEQSPKQPAPIQRKHTATSDPATLEAPPLVHEVLRSPGQPLDQSTRAFMEPRFDRDFSGVRVHTDARAAESAQQVNAQAYTVGHNIVVGAGRFAPETQSGRSLIAHELTHVVQQDGQQDQTRNLQRRPGQSWGECTSCTKPMSGSSTSAFPVSHAGLLDWVREEVWDAAVGHDRPTYIFSLLQRHDDAALNEIWKRHIAKSDWAGPPGPNWTKIIEDLNQRAIAVLVQEIKDTLLSHSVLRGSYLENDPKRIRQIEDKPDDEGLSVSIGMGARHTIRPKQELAGLRFRSANSTGTHYEVIGHENIYFWIGETDLRVKGIMAGLIAKQSVLGSELIADVWDAVGKFAKGALVAVASPVEMIIDTAAKVVDMLSQYLSKRTNPNGWFDTPFTCLSSTCREAEACLDRGDDVHKCQTEALTEAAETATMIIPLYRQGRDCLDGDYEACGSFAPVILGLMPKGGKALKISEIDRALSDAGKVEESPSGASKVGETGTVKGGKRMTKAEFEDAAIREGIGRPRAGAPHFAEALEEPKVHKEPPPTAKPKAPKSERLTKIQKQQIREFTSRFRVNLIQLETEIEILSNDAVEPAKVHIPTDARYDAEMTTSANGEIHEFEREKYGTKRWCRFSAPPAKCGVPVGADLDAKVDETLRKIKGKAGPPTPEQAATDPAAKANQPASSDSPLKQGRRESIAERAEAAKTAKLKAQRETERESEIRRVNQQIENDRSTKLRIQEEIASIEKDRRMKGPTKEAREEVLRDEEARHDARIRDAQAKLDALQVDPLVKLRGYYSDEAGRAVATRAKGIDEYSEMAGRSKKVAKPSIDHLNSVDEIATYDGFWDLFDEGRKEILSDVRNLYLMEKALNSSKGPRIRLTNWQVGLRAYGADGIAKMVKLKSEVARLLKQRIAELPKRTGRRSTPAAPPLQP